MDVLNANNALTIFEEYWEGEGVCVKLRDRTLRIYVHPDKVSIVDKLMLKELGCKQMKNYFEVKL